MAFVEISYTLPVANTIPISENPHCEYSTQSAHERWQFNPSQQLFKKTPAPWVSEEHPATADSSLPIGTEQQSPAGASIQGPLQVTSEPHMTTNSTPRSSTDKQWEAAQSPSQTNAEQQLQTDGGHKTTPEPPTMVDTEGLLSDDVVIAVMGPTGSGKSTFIRRASGHDDQGIGHELRSCTQNVLGIRFQDQESGRHVVLVDTPGFDDTFKSDLEILNMISDWLSLSYKKEKLLSGILYLHRITDNRMAGTPLKNLRVFRKLCGKDALDKVYLTTTMWDEVDQSIGEERLEELKKEYWKSMVAQGAQIFRCSSNDGSAKELILKILNREDVRKALRLQKEISDEAKELKETKAGQVLYDQLAGLVKRQIELLQRIDEERKAASDASVLADIQEEYNDLRKQIDGKQRQMQELRLSWMSNIFRKVKSATSRT
ncbi:P-loop containing nucleoside triphosphate hydrolase protein [Boletus edulis]|nr:P-loop containing nucleoside triphosphate hydrolase protein [Boletus edulis]